MKKEDVPKLIPGSRYRVLSMMTRDEPMVTEGEFKGFTVVGSMDALCMEIERETGPERPKGAKTTAKGRGKKAKMLRLVPAQMVIAIDVLDQAKEKKREEAPSDARYYV